MSKRKNYGTLLLLSSLVLGVFLLLGSFIWMQDKANMMLAVFVLILYGMGQWLTVAYWQRIQADWETTGEILARLQQAVGDIPAALDSNLKAIGTRLAEGQQQALERLQGQVDEGARQTLEKGAAQIGDSLARHLQEPMAVLRATVEAWSERSGEQASRFQAMAEASRDAADRTAEKGASLVSASLEKHLGGPLSVLQASLTVWQGKVEMQLEASRALWNEFGRVQLEWGAKVESLAASLTGELRALAAAGVRSGEETQAAWAERAQEVQAGWERHMRLFQDNLREEMGREGRRLGESLSAAAAELLARLESLQAAQVSGQQGIMEQAFSGFDQQGRALREAAAEFQAGLGRSQEAARKLVEDMEEKSSAAHARLVGELSDSQGRALDKAAGTLEAQGELGLELAHKVAELAGQMREGTRGFQELSHLAQINQTEMQAGVGMLNAGLASILDRLEKQAAAGDGQQVFLAELTQALASFQERASEVLVENALKTQEILMEVLSQAERKSRSENIATVS